MDDLTAGEALPHVSAAHIDLPLPIQALGGTAEYCASKNRGSRTCRCAFPKILEATMCGIVIKYLITTSLSFIAKPGE